MSLKDAIQGKLPLGRRRASGWQVFKNNFLKMNPACVVCGGKKKLEVHHIVPVHVDRSRELDPTNVMTLCEAKKRGINCHLLIGHLGDYRRENQRVREDAFYMAERLRREA